MFRVDEYIVAETIEHALDLIERYKDAIFIAGATDVYVQKKGCLDPLVLIDISRIKDLKGIKEENGMIRIGSVTTISEICSSEIIKNKASVLYDAAQVMGSPEIRNMATLGGNIANASPVADTLPPLFVLDAVVSLVSKNGKRRIKIEDFPIAPGISIKKREELIENIEFPCMKETSKGFYLRLGTRKALTISKVGVAFLCDFKENRIINPRIALGSVAPKVIRAKNTEKYLDGKILSKETISKAVNMIKNDASPITDYRSTKEYREAMTGELLSMGLMEWI